MNLLEKAEMVARWAHRDQTDLEGMPYWTHCKRVANNLKAAGYDEVVQAIGWLHDVVEDTTVTYHDLLGLFACHDGCARLCNGVVAMTQLPGEPLPDYWDRVKANEDSRIVKLFGDIPDNDDPQRRERAQTIKGVAWAIKQQDKYYQARKHLMTEKEWNNYVGSID